MPPPPAPTEVAVRAGGGDGVRVRRALVIGVEKYRKPIPRLPTCAQDAIRVARVLAARGYRVKAVHDGPGSTAKPTRAAVRAAVGALARAVDADDLVVVYAACHGRVIEGRPFLLLADTDDDDVAGTGLALAEVLTRLRGGARWASIFLDTCRLGLGLDPTTGDVADDADSRDGGFGLLAASSNLEEAQDVARAGVFSKQLALGLAGVASDAAGGVRFSTLGRHVQDGVERARTDPARRPGRAPVLRLEIADLELAPAPVYRELAERDWQPIVGSAFSRTGKLLATVGADCAIRLWDAATGAALGDRMTHSNAVRAVSFSADGRRLWSVDADGGVVCWNVARTTAIAPAPARLADPEALYFSIDGAAWSPTVEGQLVASARASALPGVTDPSTVDLGDPSVRARLVSRDAVLVRDGRTTRRLEWPGHSASAMVWAPTGNRFYSGCGDNLDLPSWSPRTGRTGVAGHHGSDLLALAISPDGKHLAGGGGLRGEGAPQHQPRIWRIATGASIELAGHRGMVMSVAYSADGAQLATACFDGIVRLWDAASGQLLRELPVVADGVRQHPEVWTVAFSPDRRWLFAGYSDGAGRLFELGARP